MSKRLLIMAGGTGGHVFPGLAVAELLRGEGWSIHWLGTADRMEAELVPSHGFPISFIDIQGVRGNGLVRLLAAPLRIGKSIWQAWRVLRQQRPDLVLGMGGFASGPGGVAAWLCRVPLVLHEQNAAAGLTNRLLARFARRVLMGFPGAFPQLSKAEVVGNPVRADFVALGRQPAKVIPEDRPLRVLIVGGSLGARPLNQRVPSALARVPGLEIRHQCGKGNAQAVTEAYQAAGVADVTVSDFILDMAAAYDWADLVICRAGALTVAEVAAAGVPAIFVPLPHAVDDHQTRNAESLARAGAALVLPQTQLTDERLALEVGRLNDQREQLTQMAAAAKAVAILDATERVAAVCRQLTVNRE